MEEVVVTGSRIRREASDTTTNEPLTIVDAQTLTDRGYTQAGDALNALTAMAPSKPVTPNNGQSSGSGQQFPNLFDLGPGRTLTLVNGRRFVDSVVAHNDGSGKNVDPAVDTNMLPTGLLQRVEVVQAGGSVVYGSDAIAGVVNYVLKDHFTGAEFDAQTGLTSKHDYPQNSVRGTFGTNFDDDKGNIAVDLEWSKTKPLMQSDRSADTAAIGYTAADSNPLYAGPNGGISSVAGVNNSHFWEFNNNGVLFVTPPGTGAGAYQAAFGGGFFVTQNGQSFAKGGIPTQFNSAGSALIPYNPGTFPAGTPAGSVNPVFASGGDGYSYQNLGSLYSGVERRVVNVLGHLDLASNVKLSMELTYGHTRGNDPNAINVGNTVLNNQASGAGAVIINANNPYLPASARTTIYNYLASSFGPSLAGLWMAQGSPGVPPLSQAVPGFAVDLSKNWAGLLPSYAGITDTDTLRALLALDGDFSWLNRDFDWSVSASRGHSHSTFNYDDVIVTNLNNALNAVNIGTAANPNIVCAINATTVVNPACQPINPFGSGPYSAAQQNYVTGVFGNEQVLTEDDYLATLGGPITSLPAGQAKFSTTYEHRQETANFDPTQDSLLGLAPGGVPTASTSGSYHTNEVSTELLIPIMGKDFTVPGVNALELEGAYRFVDNSLAGSANLWQAGLRWTVVPGVTLRGSRSVNFRAPNLNEVFAPTVTALGSVTTDPCDSRRINAGPNPAVRLANCEAEFAAHPSYNSGKGSLTNYQDPAQNFSTAEVTSAGNPNLKNEVSHTWTFGTVLQPPFLPGLSIVADRIEIKLINALSQFTPENFLEACYDTTGPARNPACSTFTRNSNGDIVSATSTFFNAGSQSYKGETYNVNYQRYNLNLNLEVTHNDVNDISVTGTDLTRLAGSVLDPRWVGRFDAAYTWRQLRLTYELYYLPRTLATTTATPENTPTPWIAANVQHSISTAYQLTDELTIRAGVINLTDQMPSYPTLNYGDILGRRFFLGVNLHL
ncbi:MAG: iron complex outerrane recepter protein [Gammaproteobacteria bacterium]|nr:iron complex outerrane recepter protein [Gammaproteobacteria bacterium]